MKGKKPYDIKLESSGGYEKLKWNEKGWRKLRLRVEEIWKVKMELKI